MKRNLSPAEMANKAAGGEESLPIPEEASDEELPGYSSPLPPLILGEPPPKREALSMHPVSRGRPPGREQHNQSHRMRALAHMAALGMKVSQMAKSLGVGPARISVLIASPEFKQTVKDIQAELFLNEPQAVFRQMAPAAAQTLYNVMRDEDEKGSTRVSAASEVLDRAYGKAQQKIEHEAAGIKDLFRQLDEEKKHRHNGGSVVDADYQEVLDPVDALVEKIYESERPVQTAPAKDPQGSDRIPDGGDEGEA